LQPKQALRNQQRITIAKKVLDDVRPTERPVWGTHQIIQKWTDIAEFSGFLIKTLNLIIHLSKSRLIFIWAISVSPETTSTRRSIPPNAGEFVPFSWGKLIQVRPNFSVKDDMTTIRRPFSFASPT